MSAIAWLPQIFSYLPIPMSSHRLVTPNIQLLADTHVSHRLVSLSSKVPGDSATILLNCCSDMAL